MPADSVREQAPHDPAPIAFSALGLHPQLSRGVADLGFNDLDAPIQRLTGAFCPTPYSPALESAVIPQPSDIAQAIRNLIRE